MLDIRRRVLSFLALLALATCLGQGARGDTFTITLTDLKGNPLPNAELRVYKQKGRTPSESSVDISDLQAKVTALMADARPLKDELTGLDVLRSDPNGIVTLKVAPTGDDVSVVLVSNRANALPTAVSPMIVANSGKGESNQTLRLAVPEYKPPASAGQPGANLCYPAYYYHQPCYYFYSYPTCYTPQATNKHGILSVRRR